MARSKDIHTTRLLITPFSERHLTEGYLAWLNDPVLMRFSRQRHLRHTLASCRDYYRSFENSPNFFWALERVHPQPGHIGNLNAYVDTHHQVADLGILIGEQSARGQNFGLEAWLGVCGFLFTECALRKITAGTVSLNIPMLRLMHGAGMVADGIRKKQVVLEGRTADIIHMALFREHWQNGTPSNQGTNGT